MTDKYIHLILLLFPLFTGFKGYNKITESKFFFFAGATALWLCAIAACGIVALVKGNDREGRPKLHFSAGQWCIAAFMAVNILSAALSPYGTKCLLGAGRYDGLVTTLLYGAACLGVSLFARPGRRYIFSLGISTFLCCAAAVFQLMDVNVLHLFPDGVGYYDHGVFYSGEFLGTIGNANLLGAFLCLGIPLCGAGFVTGRNRADALLLIPAALGTFILVCSRVSGAAVGICACALLCAPAVITDGDRLRRMFLFGAAMLLALGAAAAFTPDAELERLAFSGWKLPVLALICALAACCLGKIRYNCGRHTLLVIFLCISAACVVGFILALWFWPGRTGTMYELSRVIHGELDDKFGSSRVLIWRNVLALIPERPLLGGGPDTLALRLDIHFSRYVEETGRTLSTYVDNAHNEYLGYLANIGALGLGAYLAAMAFTAADIIKKATASGISAALGCALVCYWVQSFFGLGLCLTAPVMWVVWGLALANTDVKT